jgi:uroporphyrinogen-III synthase
MPASGSDALAGVSVALLESRMSAAMGELVTRYGGMPRFVPALRETPIDCRAPVAAFLRTLETAADRLVVFLTGAGASVLFDEADRQGRLPFLVEALSGATLVCRGPKPAAALKRRRLTATICAREPYTTAELLDALSGRDLRSVQVTVVHYGERSATLAAELLARGALLHELCVYEWRLPEDTGPMRSLIDDVLAGRVDAVVFTSQIQGRHLLRVAADAGARAPLVEALNSRVVVAAVGPVCRAALEEDGIVPHIVPANPRMGALVASLAGYYAARRQSESHGDL